MKWIDSHCHLNYDYSPKSASDLIREAKEAGVAKLVTIGTEVATLPQVVSISESDPDVFHTVGVHPHEAAAFSPSDRETLERAAQHPKCRGIGEIGLDYHYDHSPRDVQRRRLDEQLELALSVAQPVIIHCREAEEDMLGALRNYAKAVPAPREPGVIHCFTGTQAFGEACLALGFYVSFSGIITFKTADELRACVRAFPLDRLLVETDAPFLAPIPYRGKRCEPVMVIQTGMKVAEVKGVPLSEVAQATTANAERLFRL